MSRQIKRMFWDIETSPNIGYFWRTGWRVRLSPENIIKERKVICICWKWEGQSKIHSLSWDNGDDKQLIKGFLKEVIKADEIIAHNGDHFDFPWFKGQLAKYDLGSFPEVKTIDTYQIAKRNFNYNNYSLDYLSNLWFEKRKIKTGFDLWIRVMNGQKKALKEMVTYCKRDVELQEMVWNKLVPYYKPKTHVGVLQGKPKWTCPHDGSVDVIKKQERPTATGARRHQMQCKECGRHYTISDSVYHVYLNIEQ